jgi:hypothetical protein
MDEARRFLRYVTPGIIFALELTILLFVLRPEWKLEKLLEFGKDSGIATILVALLASGGLGFIFSTIHHHLHSLKWCDLMDHTQVINQLRNEGVLDLQGLDKTYIPTKKQAWVIVTAVWHQRLKTCDKIGSVEPRTKDLVDIMHSMGTARVASGTAVLVAFGSVFATACCGQLSLPMCRVLSAVGIAVGAYSIFQIGYVRTARLAQAVIDEVLSDALHAEKENHKVKNENDKSEKSKEEKPIRTWPRLPKE